MDQLSILQITGFIITFGSSVGGILSPKTWNPIEKKLTKPGKIIMLISVIGLSTSVVTTVMERSEEKKAAEKAAVLEQQNMQKIDTGLREVTVTATAKIEKSGEDLKGNIKDVNDQAKKIKANVTELKKSLTAGNQHMAKLLSETLTLSEGIFNSTDLLKTDFKNHIDDVKIKMVGELKAFSTDTKELVSSSAKSYAEHIDILKKAVESKNIDIAQLNEKMDKVVRQVSEIQLTVNDLKNNSPIITPPVAKTDTTKAKSQGGASGPGQ